MTTIELWRDAASGDGPHWVVERSDKVLATFAEADDEGARSDALILAKDLAQQASAADPRGGAQVVEIDEHGRRETIYEILPTS